MAQVIFSYNGNGTNIQCNLDEKMKEICKRYATKLKYDINKLYFLYDGKIINEDLNFYEQANENDKKRKAMNILVYDSNSIIKETLCKSNEIICPICKENIYININDYKINLFDCKNKHNIRNISLKNYEKTQNIDISKIICDKCQIKNKSNTYNNEFYICLNCNINICPLCKLNYENEHEIINYDLKNYICNKHKENYTKYCNECKLN